MRGTIVLLAVGLPLAITLFSMVLVARAQTSCKLSLVAREWNALLKTDH